MTDDRILRINITDDQGTLLCATTITRGELEDAQNSPLAAHCLVNEFEVGR